MRSIGEDSRLANAGDSNLSNVQRSQQQLCQIKIMANSRKALQVAMSGRYRNSNACSLLSFSLCGGGVEDAAAKWVAVAVNSEAQAH